MFFADFWDSLDFRLAWQETARDFWIFGFKQFSTSLKGDGGGWRVYVQPAGREIRRERASWFLGRFGEIFVVSEGKRVWNFPSHKQKTLGMTSSELQLVPLLPCTFLWLDQCAPLKKTRQQQHAMISEAFGVWENVSTVRSIDSWEDQHKRHWPLLSYSFSCLPLGLSKHDLNGFCWCAEAESQGKRRECLLSDMWMFSLAPDEPFIFPTKTSENQPKSNGKPWFCLGIKTKP